MRALRVSLFLGVATIAMSAAAQTPTIRTVDWTPPRSSLPPKFVHAVQLMLGNGLSDPRNAGPLSKFEVLIGPGRGTPREVEQAYGWAIPGTNTAILVDGLTHPVIKRLRAATNEELIAAKKAKPETLTQQLLDDHTLAALFLVRGEVSALASLVIPENEDGNDLIRLLQLRFRMELAQALGDRRDQDALQLAWQLGTVEAAIDKSPLSPENRAELLQKDSGLKLYEDCQRRLKSPSPRPDLKKLRQLPSATRIQQLLAAFDEVNARQTDNPGIPWYAEDPIYKALLDEGDAAIPALIDAMEADHRYSRSIGFWRSYALGRDFIQVRWVAASAIREIWPPSVELMRREDFSHALLREVWRDPVAKRKLRSQHEASEREFYNSLRLHSQAQQRVAIPQIRVNDWRVPETSIHPRLTSLTKAILGNGLSDPRKGGQLSLLQAKFGPIMGVGERLVAAYGWPISGTKTAIFTDGMTRNYVRVVRPIPVPEFYKLVIAGSQPFTDLRDDGSAIMPLLLVRGEVAAAEALARFWGTGTGRTTSQLHWHLRRQVADALTSGRDRDALERADRLVALQQVSSLIEPVGTISAAEAAEGLALYRDLLRRVQHPAKRVDLQSSRKLLPGDRIRALIVALEDVRHPEKTGIGQDPIFRAVVRENTAAVPSLLHAMEFDQRYSRTVSFQRRLMPACDFHKVSHIAELALQVIWPASRWLMRERGKTVQELRSIWSDYQVRSELESEFGGRIEVIFEPNLYLSARTADPTSTTIRSVDWTPPATKLPATFVAEVKAVLGNGLSDPRGTGSLCLFEIETGVADGSPRRTVQIYGWPIPGTRKAVMVDGLTYTFRRKVRAALNQEIKTVPPAPIHHFAVPGEATTALLLLRGEVAAAETLIPQKRFNNQSLALHLLERYRMEYCEAHVAGKDREALAIATQMLPLEQVLISWEGNLNRDLYLRRPDRAELLHKDSLRRVRSPLPPLDLDKVKELSQPERIKALIWALEDFRAERPFQFDFLRVDRHPVLKALVAEGAAAMPALLDTLEYDQRTARVASPNLRDIGPHRSVLTVRYLAEHLIKHIWTGSHLFTNFTTVDAKIWREAWVKHGHRPGADQALAAITKLDLGFQRVDEICRGMFYPDFITRKTGYDSLTPRQRALLLRIMENMIFQDQRRSYIAFHISFIEYIARVDLDRAIPMLERVIDETLTLISDPKELDTVYGSHLERSLGTATRLRLTGAAAKFEEYLANKPRQETSVRLEDSPFVRAPADDVAMTDFKDRFFTQWEAEALNPQTTDRFPMDQKLSYTEKALLLEPRYRKFLIHTLGVESPVGEIRPLGNDSFERTLLPAVADRRTGIMSHPSLVNLNQPHVLTLAEFAAMELQSLPGCPRFTVSALPEERTKSIRAIRVWLQDPAVDWSKIVWSYPRGTDVPIRPHP